MPASYNDSLARFKSSFLGDTECDVWVKGVTSLAVQDTLEILDIGIGDCASISRRCDILLANSISVRLTGVDPVLPDLADCVNPPIDSVLIRAHFEAYRPTGKFDVVNATHVLYYLTDILGALRRIVSMTKPGGLVVLTVWSQECVLCKLFKECFSEASSDVLTAERVSTQLADVAGIGDVQILRGYGGIDLASWASDDSYLDAGVKVISRGNVNSSVTPAQQLRLRTALRGYASVEQRVNGVVIGRKVTE
jgi:SAM-dependent methyltransferase